MCTLCVCVCVEASFSWDVFHHCLVFDDDNCWGWHRVGRTNQYFFFLYLVIGFCVRDKWQMSADECRQMHQTMNRCNNVREREWRKKRINIDVRSVQRKRNSREKKMIIKFLNIHLWNGKSACNSFFYIYLAFLFSRNVLNLSPAILVLIGSETWNKSIPLNKMAMKRIANEKKEAPRCRNENTHKIRSRKKLLFCCCFFFLLTYRTHRKTNATNQSCSNTICTSDGECLDNVPTTKWI